VSSSPTESSTCAETCPTRRAALAFGAAAGAAALLTGCSTYGGSSSAATAAADPKGADSNSADSKAADSKAADSKAADSSDSAGDSAGGAVLAQTADIPVGSGKIFAAKGVVVTQPTKGTFKAFSTVCTHQGCAVEKIQDGTIDCLCHGSKFKITDGSVANGPATRPLPAKKITVQGDSVHLA